MTPGIAGFMEAFPGVELDIDFTDLLVDVIHGGFDVVAHTGEPTESRLMTKTLGSYSLIALGAPSYFQRAGVPQTPPDLLGYAASDRTGHAGSNSRPPTGTRAAWRSERQ
jgi:DNA-binding transcriptional LysR family regulator